jgi:hypothetical protein
MPGNRDQINRSTLAGADGTADLQIQPEQTGTALGEEDPNRFAPGASPAGPSPRFAPQAMAATQLETNPNRNAVGATGPQLAAPPAAGQPSVAGPSPRFTPQTAQEVQNPEKDPANPQAAAGPSPDFYISPLLQDQLDQSRTNVRRLSNMEEALATRQAQIGKERSTPLPVSGLRRFGGVMAGVGMGLLTRNPMAGIAASRDITMAPEELRNERLDRESAGITKEQAPISGELTAEKDILGSLTSQAGREWELNKQLNMPRTTYRPNAVGELEAITGTPSGKIIDVKPVSPGPMVMVKDPKIRALLPPEYQDQPMISEKLAKFYRDEAYPPSAATKAAEWSVLRGTGGEPTGIQRVGADNKVETYNMRDIDNPNTPEVARATLMGFREQEAAKRTKDVAQRVDIASKVSPIMEARQARLAQLRQQLQNSAAPAPFKAQLPAAQLTREMADIIIKMVTDKPQLVGPVAGRLEKLGFTAGTDFGFANPQDEQDAATLAGHLQYLYGNELRGAITGRPPQQMLDEFKQVSAKISQDPNLIKGFIQSAVNNANLVTNNGKKLYGIDLGQGIVPTGRPASGTRPPLTDFEGKKK